MMLLVVDCYSSDRRWMRKILYLIPECMFRRSSPQLIHSFAYLDFKKSMVIDFSWYCKTLSEPSLFIPRWCGPVSYIKKNMIVSNISKFLCLKQYDFIEGRWLLGMTLCQLFTTADILLCTSSILNLCAIALDRYWAIHDPIGYAQKRTLKFVCRTIAVVSKYEKFKQFQFFYWAFPRL